jgi:hypothetical protein
MSTNITSKGQVFYLPLSERPLTPAFQELLKNYSKIPSNEIEKHLEGVVRFHPFSLFPKAYSLTLHSAMTHGTTTPTPPSGCSSSSTWAYAVTTYQKTIRTRPKILKKSNQPTR